MDPDGIDDFQESVNIPNIAKEDPRLDPRFVYEPFLELSEFGDAASFRHRLIGMESEERRRLVRSVDQHGCTGLLLAAKQGDSELLDVLLDAHANPNDADSGGVTALHYAVAKGSHRMAASLLRCSANVDQRDDRSDTPLMWARGAQALDMLIAHRASINSGNLNGETALICAATRGDCEGLLQLAVVAGVQLDACDHKGITAYEAALKAGLTSAAARLVELGAAATSNAIGLCPNEALFEAALGNDASAIAAFVKANPGLSVDVVGGRGGETPLLRACAAGAFQAVDAFLCAGADPCKADASIRETSLHRAVLSGSSEELIWLLLEARADPFARDIAGRTPADIARIWKRPQCEELLNAVVHGELDVHTFAS